MAPCRQSVRLGSTTRTRVEGVAAEHVNGPDLMRFSFEMAMFIRFRTVAPVKDWRSTLRRPHTCGRERNRGDERVGQEGGLNFVDCLGQLLVQSSLTCVTRSK